MDKLFVYVERSGKPLYAGDLTLIDDVGEQVWEFQYSAEALRKKFSGISLSLPLQKEPHSGREVRVFFNNLLPEADQKEQIARRLNISVNNDFKLLEVLGGEVAGAITLSSTPITEDDRKPSYRELNDNDLIELMETMAHDPMLASTGKNRLSLAGAQSKIPIMMMDRKIYLPENNSPSTHILKPAPNNDHYPHLAENEYFCMFIARSLNLFPVAKAFLHQIGDRKGYIVSRYDRYIYKKKVYRYHQEDFCQAMSYRYTMKYEAEGGPGFKEIASFIRKYSSRIPDDIRQLVTWAIFNFIVGNMDAHAKNVSLLYNKEISRVSLAPAYDLVNTMVYPLDMEMAMDMGGESNPNYITTAELSALAEDIGVKPRYVFNIAKNCLEKLAFMPGLKKIEMNLNETECDIYNQIAGSINERLEYLKEMNLD